MAAARNGIEHDAERAGQRAERTDRDDERRRLRASLTCTCAESSGTSTQPAVHRAEPTVRAANDSVLDASRSRHGEEAAVHVAVDDRTTWRGDWTARVVDLHQRRGRQASRAG